MTNSLNPTDQDIQDFLDLGCLPEEIISELGASLTQMNRVISKMPANSVSKKNHEGLFDLAEELEADEVASDLVTGESGLSTLEELSIEETLSVFKRGVGKIISEHDSATHFDLGIAFKEMGIYDDAIQEFIIASHLPYRYGDSMMMASLCLREKGDNLRAVETCRIALTSEGLKRMEAAALYYELGQALQALGCYENAIWAIMEGEALDPQFGCLTVLLANLKDVNPVPISLTEPFVRPLS